MEPSKSKKRKLCMDGAVRVQKGSEGGDNGSKRGKSGDGKIGEASGEEKKKGTKASAAAAEIEGLFASLSDKKKEKKEANERLSKQKPRGTPSRSSDGGGGGSGGGSGGGKKGSSGGGGGSTASEQGVEGRRYDAGRDDPDVRPWKRDATGMAVYDPEIMRIGRGGGTNLCPFDCNCCF